MVKLNKSQPELDQERRWDGMIVGFFIGLIVGLIS